MFKVFKIYCVVISIITFIFFILTMIGIQSNIVKGSTFDLIYKALFIIWIIGSIFYIGFFLYCNSKGVFKDKF